MVVSRVELVAKVRFSTQEMTRGLMIARRLVGKQHSRQPLQVNLLKWFDRVWRTP